MKSKFTKYREWIFAGIFIWMALMVIFNATTLYAYPGFIISTLVFIVLGILAWRYRKKTKNIRSDVIKEKPE